MDDKPHLLPPADSAQVVTYELDLDSGTLQWSDTLYSLLGYDRSEPTHTLDWWAAHIHQDDAMVLNETMDMLEFPWVKEWTVDYRLEKADKSYVLVHDQAKVVRDASGKAVQLKGLIWPAEVKQ